MYCMAELSTAMPKAGGTYYFLDRAMGPLMGTIGGLGSWVAVVFKSAFALVGIGAYLGLYVDLPITITAVALTIVFGLVNVFGAKETTMLQRVLVTTLVVILVAFVLMGLKAAGFAKAFEPVPAHGDFFKTGLVGFISTIGLVFVSYAGLTKVASVAEEVQNPDRNIPLGMTLSLITATVIYTLGTVVLIRVLDHQALYASLTPIADAGRVFLDWVPYDFGVILIIVAAVAAFASTGNAGIMSASRYPYAMAKDKLVPKSLNAIGKHGTPTKAITITVLAMVFVLLLFDVASVAKLASAFQLLLFGLVCVAVIVMRESKIPTYKPGYKAPFYPWLQVAGVLISFWLIIEMGILAVAFTGMMVIGCVLWYQFYAYGRLERRGAIFHVHQRLGKHRYDALELELMTIIHERTQDENLSYEALIARSVIIDLNEGQYNFEKIKDCLREHSDQTHSLKSKVIDEVFTHKRLRLHQISDSVHISYKTHKSLKQPELFVLRFGQSVELDEDVVDASDHTVKTIIFLMAPLKPVGLDLRLAGHLAEVAQSEHFEQRWFQCLSQREMKEVLMRDDHFLHGSVQSFPSLLKQAGKKVADVVLPPSCLITMIEREGSIIVATSETVLLETDEVAIIGESVDLDSLKEGAL